VTDINLSLQSYEVWDPWAKWELQNLEELSSTGARNPQREAELRDAVARVNDMFLARLRQPHSSEFHGGIHSFMVTDCPPDCNATIELYSPFVSSYFPDNEYEARLVAATKTRELPLKQLSWREGNPKRVREHLELRALNGGLVEWRQYVTWELKAKKPQRKFILAIYERAVECAARERWRALCEAENAPNDSTLGEVVKAKEINLKEIWEEYIVYAVSSHFDALLSEMCPYHWQSSESSVDPGELLHLTRRATRAVPDSGSIWAFYMRMVEMATSSTETTQVEWDETVDGGFSFHSDCPHAHMTCSYLCTDAPDEFDSKFFGRSRCRHLDTRILEP